MAPDGLLELEGKEEGRDPSEEESLACPGAAVSDREVSFPYDRVHVEGLGDEPKAISREGMDRHFAQAPNEGNGGNVRSPQPFQQGLEVGVSRV